MVENIVTSVGIVKEKNQSVEQNEEKNEQEMVMYDTPTITTIKPDESGYVHTSTTPIFSEIMFEVDRTATQVI